MTKPVLPDNDGAQAAVRPSTQAAPPFPIDLARRIGAEPPLDGQEKPEPSQLDKALYWAAEGLHIFPCRTCIGIPLISDWHRGGSASRDKIVEWWLEYPEADIACMPEVCGYFVISGIGDIGMRTLDMLEAKYDGLGEDFRTETPWGSEHCWFPLNGKRVHSSFGLIGPGIRVFGPGQFLYLPNSLALLPGEILPTD